MLKITSRELEQLYLENSNKYVCEYLGITTSTLVRYLKRYNIGLKGKGNKTGSNAKICIIDEKC
jgi:hypothetical protein